MRPDSLAGKVNESQRKRMRNYAYITRSPYANAYVRRLFPSNETLLHVNMLHATARCRIRKPRGKATVRVV